MTRKFYPAFISLLICYFLAAAATPYSQKTGAPPPKLPTMREQAEIQQQWLKSRLERVLPELMRKHDVSMWLVICREYNEDPVFRALTSPTVFAARRRTILIFYDQGREKGIERLALGGGSNGDLYHVYRDPEVENRELWGEGQWALLRKVIADRDPKTIAVNATAPESIVPSGKLTRDEVIAKLKESRAKSLKFAEETKLPLKAHTLDHPFPVFNTLNAYQWLIYIPLHNIRHNKQIEEVKSDPNFPKVVLPR